MRKREGLGSNKPSQRFLGIRDEPGVTQAPNHSWLSGYFQRLVTVRADRLQSVVAQTRCVFQLQEVESSLEVECRVLSPTDFHYVEGTATPERVPEPPLLATSRLRAQDAGPELLTAEKEGARWLPVLFVWRRPVR